jgi:hypothetical protein
MHMIPLVDNHKNKYLPWKPNIENNSQDILQAWYKNSQKCPQFNVIFLQEVITMVRVIAVMSVINFASNIYINSQYRPAEIAEIMIRSRQKTVSTGQLR